MFVEAIKNDGFSRDEIEAFRMHGYVIVRGLASRAACEEMQTTAERHLAQAIAPLEYEADVHYPGAPPSRDVPGGGTVRRLLQAYARDPAFARWASNASVVARLRQLLGTEVTLALAHHNCVMTKQPHYSSATLWHQDIRYWSFQRPELISVWLALGHEAVVNGCLLALPGSHTMEFRDERLDGAKFLRTELEENAPLLRSQIAVELEFGDVLFFHCRLLHAAGRNQSSATKFSVVFTYHAADNHPLAETRSTSLPEVMLG